MKIRTKIGIIFFVIGLGIMFSYVYFSTKSNRQQNLSYEFNGVVQNVRYDVKGLPTVLINRKAYYLSAGYNFNYQIEQGDTLSKIRGASIYVLTKKATNQKLEFNNERY